jgi:ATP-dependent helicase/nuclease subunit A
MASFKVIRASAGSGKTFNLTGEYLRLLYTETEAFMHILAVTFTNKATEEMKTRIIRELFSLASNEQSNQLAGLMVSTSLNEKQIRNRASNILKRILHKYSRFSVSTIDSFFQRIIRNFTQELGIQEGYTIELDTEVVLSDAISKLMVNAEHDKELLSWLTLFAESLIEKGENWNLKDGIRNLGQQIFKEDFKSLGTDEFRLYSDRKFLELYKTELYAISAKIEKTYRDFGQRAILLIQQQGLQIDDFSNKNRGPAGFLIGLATGSFREPTSTAKAAVLSVEKWATANASRRNEILDIAERELMPLMQEAVTYYELHHHSYFTASVVLKNLFTLGILIDLSKQADQWCAENNAFLLTEAPGFLHKIIDGNDTPFIYEKTGFWFHHYMIDEFQDTSMLQWMNFKPLISNSLSQDYDNLAVGDTKQSIYRWRNSNWEILESKIGQDFMPGVIEAVTLKENWRSRRNIISFNNRYFREAASLLQEEIDLNVASQAGITLRPITDLYGNMEQLPGGEKNEGGVISVQYIESSNQTDFTDAVNHKILDLIFELLDKGYHQNDIALLTRKNRESKLLAGFLLNHASDRFQQHGQLDVISDEALRLGSSVAVNTIIALLQYIIDPDDRTNNYLIQSVFSNYLDAAAEQKPWINAPAKTDQDNIPDFPEEFSKLAGSPGSFSLIEIIERIIRIFSLDRHPGELVYIMAFKDMAMEYAQKNGSDLSGFVEFWNEKGAEKSVSAPVQQDAIRILTIHKAKGLEFKVTIIPYCSWELNTYNKTILWCKPNLAPFNQLPVIPVTYTTALQHTIFSGDYFKEYYLQIIDNLNMLYVAFTRAQHALYVFCKSGDKDNLKNVSDLSRKVLGNHDYAEGSLESIAASNALNINRLIQFLPAEKAGIGERVKIAFQGKLMIDPGINKPYRPTNEGNILHEIFTHIRYRSDIKTAVSKLHIQGKITSEELEYYAVFIEYAMNDVQVSSWFTEEWKIINEAEIILPGGHIKRPDRVITNEKQTVVIDYKFGNLMSHAYETQVKSYAALMQQMGYQNVEAFLWYVSRQQVIACKVN